MLKVECKKCHKPLGDCDCYQGEKMKCECGYAFKNKEKHQTPDIVCPKCGKKK